MSENTEDLKRSPLHDRHVALGARLVPFAGWEMPVQYEGILREHRAVRESCGVFDISHMGEITVRSTEGTKAAAAYLNHLLTNDASVLKPGQGQYTLMLNERGGVIDDLILYRTRTDGFFLVVNASKLSEDLIWLEQEADSYYTVRIEDHSAGYGALAVQGPKSQAIYEKVAKRLPGSPALPPRNGIIKVVAEGDEDNPTPIRICRTGYTGEDGFEFFCPAAQTPAWFDAFLEAGAVPCGLGARDTLRLEKCYPLNGSDLDGYHTPLEAGLKPFVKMGKDEFLGHDALKVQLTKGLPSKLSAICVTGKAPPPRTGYAVVDPETKEPIGELSSGSLSPSLGTGIGLAYLPLEKSAPGTEVCLDIRGRLFPAVVSKKPFI